MVEAVILLTASRGNSAQALRDAATAYKVDTDAIVAKVKQEFVAKEKAKTEKKTALEQPRKASGKAAKPAKKASA
jgi:ParB family chromosome partitioning protein